MTTKNIHILLLSFVFLFINACNEKEQSDDLSSEIAVKFISDVDDSPKTKASNTSWNDGDLIGVFMLKTGTQSIFGTASNKEYSVTTDGQMSPVGISNVIYYPVDITTNVDFVAYYPYQTTITNFDYPIDVSIQTNQQSLDLLYAANSEAKNRNKLSGNVALKFNHMLSKLEFNISIGADMTTDLTNLKVILKGMNTKADFNLVSGILNNDNNLSTLTTLTSPDGKKSEAIVIPNNNSGRTIQFILNNGDVHAWNIPDSKVFNPGEKTIYNVTITQTGLELSASIITWIENQNQNIVITN